MKGAAELGWIGLGKMGGPLVTRLLKQAHHLTVYDIDTRRVEKFTGQAISLASSPAEVARRSDIIFTMVSDDKALEQVVTGPSGVLAGASPQTLLVDLGTHSPKTSARLAEHLDRAGVSFLRAPVSGTIMHAAAGSLVLFASGSESAFEQCRPLFSAFAKKCYYLGQDEEARYLKILHNAMLGVTALMLAEALTFGEKAGLDLSLMMDILNESVVASPVMGYKTDSIKNRSFDLTFPATHMAKDLDLALDTARRLVTPMPLAVVARQFIEIMQATGRGEEDFFALLSLMEDLAGIRTAAKPATTNTGKEGDI